MLIVPLPEMGSPVPACQQCFDGALLGGYTLTESGRVVCDRCLPAGEVGSPAHPWPEELLRAVMSRVEAAALPTGFEVTAYNLCRYATAAERHPAWLSKLTTWLQLTPDPDEPEPRGQWLGVVKERVTFLNIRMDPAKAQYLGPSDYGDRYLFRFRDEAGNLIVWFTGETCKIPDGWSGNLKATVKEHAVYAGERQTVIQRGTVVDDDGGESRQGTQTSGLFGRRGGGRGGTPVTEAHES